MRLTDRLLRYLEFKGLTVYSFEKACAVGNGYFGKQHKGKGAMGSDILERIAQQYPDLSLTWLITGRGSMLQKPPKGVKVPKGFMLKEEEAVYAIRNKLVASLKEQLKLLEKSLPRDKG
ncbi:MAG TPA: hypothetical protein VF487_18890 [Chitinophagaceae bacterium]